MSFCSSAILRCNTKDTASLLADDKFEALEETVTIIPRYTSDAAVDCIKGKFGPFRAHSVAAVPLWLALEMDKLQQCTIELPAWLHEEELKRMRDEEKAAGDTEFVKVPRHYIEIAFAFLTQSKTFANDQQDKSRTVLLLRDLVEIRRDKIRKGLQAFNANVVDEMDVTHMAAAEITCFRTRSLHALDTFHSILVSKQLSHRPEVAASSLEERPSQMEDSSSRM